MDPIRLVIFYVLFAFSLFLTARVVVELVRTFAREWRPAGGVAVTLETVYTVTDPPVRTHLRHLDPPFLLTHRHIPDDTSRRNIGLG